MFLRNLIFVIFVCFLMKIKLTTGIVTFENHAYKQIDVAIGENVPYDPKVISQIKDMFTEGSKVLYKATYQKAYFGQVNIWVPSTWNVATKEFGKKFSLKSNDNWFEDADLRLEHEPHPIHGDNPHTLQPRGCGEPGLYMHFTTYFLDNPKKHGNLGRVLVHEWAHYRYGIFNEYSDSDDPRLQFYLEPNQIIKPTLCPSHVKGWFYANGNQSCTKDSNGYPTRNCSFYPDMTKKVNENVNVSLMSVPYLENVEFFCNDEQHNEIAPTKQNELCRHASTWSIINSHQDFRNLNASTNFLDTNPAFSIFQSKRPERKQFVVALVDLSDTMAEKLETVKDSLKSFVKHRLPRNSEFAVFGFSSLYERKGALNCTEVFQKFTSVKEQAEILKNIDSMSVMQLSPSSSKRPIGQALISTLKYINEQSYHSANTSVLLITDGPTNFGPIAYDIVANLTEHKLQVNVIALGSYVKPELKKTLSKTSGEWYSVEVAEDNSTIKLHQLDSAFLQFASRIGSSEQITILRENTRTLSNGQILNVTFVAEKIGKTPQTEVFVCAKEKKEFMLTSNKPNNNPKNKLNLLVIVSNATSEVYNNISSCHFTHVQMVGEMSYLLNYTKTNWHDNLTLSVIISSRSPKHQVIPDQLLRQRQIEPNTVYPAVPIAYLILTKGYYAPIVKADVNFTACSTGSVNNSCQTFQLQDDGKGVDNFANDGVYSGVPNYIKNNGSYETSFTTRAVNGTLILRRKKIPRTGSPILQELIDEKIGEEPRDSVHPNSLRLHQPQDEFFSSEADFDFFANYEAEMIEDLFFRESFVGSFQASNYMAVDNIKPASVRDLIIKDTSLSHPKAAYLVVSLEWTASGDNEFEGIADYIEIRYAYSPDFYKNFDQGIVITVRDLQEGSLIPQEPRAKHSLKVEVKSNVQAEKTSFATYFAVRTCDKARNCEKSNVAMANVDIVIAQNIIIAGLGISTGTLTLVAVFGIVCILVVSITVVKIIHCQQDKSKGGKQKKDADVEYDLDSNFFTSKGNTSSNYYSNCTKGTEAAAQAALVAQAIEKAKKRNKISCLPESDSLLTVDETRM